MWVRKRSVHGKTGNWRWDKEQGIYTAAKCLPTNYLVVTKWKTKTNCMGEKRCDPLHQMLKVNVSTTDTNWPMCLGRLILCIHLTGPWEAQKFGQTVSWVCLWGCSWVTATLESVHWAERSPQCRGPHPIQKTWWEWKGEEETTLCLSAWWSLSWDTDLFLPAYPSSD